MAKKKKKNNSGISIIIVVVVLSIAVMSLFGYIVYRSLFARIPNKRYEGIEEHILTQDEKNNISEVFSDLKELDSVNVFIDTNKDSQSRIIKISIKLKEDVKFDDLKTLCNSSIEKVSEDNLDYYDMEVFITSEDKESEIYPQIGYKHVSNSEFSW